MSEPEFLRPSPPPGTGRSGGASDREELTHELLADLHAGLVPEPHATALRERAQRDPDAAEYLRELDAVVDAVYALGRSSEPAPPIPHDVADRLRRSFTAADPQSAYPVSDEMARRRSRRANPWTVAAAAIMVVVGTGAAITLAFGPGSGGGPTGEGSPDRSTAVASGESIGARTVMSVVGTFDSGRFTDPSVLAACLEANGVPSASTLVGSGPVTVDGSAATLLVTAGEQPGSLVALAVGPSCGPGNADTVSRADIG